MNLFGFLGYLSAVFSAGANIEDIAKAASKKIGSLHRVKSFLTPESILFTVFTSQQFTLVFSIAAIFWQVHQFLP